MSNVCWFLHKWSKWEYNRSPWVTTDRKTKKEIGYFIRTIKKRTCVQCGEIQEVFVKDTPCTKENYDSFGEPDKKE